MQNRGAIEINEIPDDPMGEVVWRRSSVQVMQGEYTGAFHFHESEPQMVEVVPLEPRRSIMTEAVDLET